MISSIKFRTNFFQHNREFIDKTYIPVIPPSFGRKRMNIVVEPDDDSEAKGDVETPNRTLASHQQPTQVYTIRQYVKVRVVRKKRR